MKFDECEFRRSEYDWCVYSKMLKHDDMIYLLLYVDDILIACKDIVAVNKLKEQWSSQLKMKELWSFQEDSAMRIIRDGKKSILFLNQSDYLRQLLDKYEMSAIKLY